jgi:hypothetical protein
MEVSLPLSDREFQSKVSIERRALRARCELICAADLLADDYTVSRPLNATRGYSLIVDAKGKLLRLQIQPARVGEPRVDLARTSYRQDDLDRTYETHEPLFDLGSFDYLVVVDRQSHDVFYVPAVEVDLRKPSFTVKEADRERYRKL